MRPLTSGPWRKSIREESKNIPTGRHVRLVRTTVGRRRAWEYRQALLWARAAERGWTEGGDVD